MKSFVATLPLAALFASSTHAFLPSCAWDDCIASWSGTSCTASSGWDCFCSNQTAISSINNCVASSCTAQADQEAIYGAIAQVCADAGATVTAAPEATFSATSGGSAWPSQLTADGLGSGWESWASRVSTALPGPPGGWNGNGPWGGPGSGWNGHGPFGGPDCAWSTWTAGWGPFSSWTGTWSGCSTTTASPSPATVTTTIDGSVITGTTFGVQAAAPTSATSGNDAQSLHGVDAPGALAVAIIAAALAL